MWWSSTSLRELAAVIALNRVLETVIALKRIVGALIVRLLVVTVPIVAVQAVLICMNAKEVAAYWTLHHAGVQQLAVLSVAAQLAPLRTLCSTTTLYERTGGKEVGEAASSIEPIPRAPTSVQDRNVQAQAEQWQWDNSLQTVNRTVCMQAYGSSRDVQYCYQLMQPACSSLLL